MKNPTVELHIAEHGVITLELDAEKAPLSVANFIKNVENAHYNNTIFHRIIPGFMIQGGGFASGMKQKESSETIENEGQNGLKNDHYTVAMARTSDPHSAGAQFFINVADNDFLNHTSPTPSGWGYAVFGKVIKGQDIVDSLSKVKTSRTGFHDDVPKEEVLLEKALLIQA